MTRPSEYQARPLQRTIFHRLRQEIQARGGEGIIDLHVGDTWLDIPCEMGLPLEEEPWSHGMSRYGDTQGEPELRRLLSLKVRERNRLPVSTPDEVQCTFGATGGLFLALGRLLAPGAEVLVLAPYWAILKVVASQAGVRLVEAPFFDRLRPNSDEDDIWGILEPYVSDRTQGIYFNTPNNPTGVALWPHQIQSLSRFATHHDLWVFSDEAYEDFLWANMEYVSIGALPGMFERTVSVFSFSKSFASAGLRLGYVAAPLGVIGTLNPAQVSVGYEPSRTAQVQAIRGLRHQNRILAEIQSQYLEGLKAATKNIRLPHLRPDGSFYLFVDLGDRWRGKDEEAKLQSMIQAGVAVSPGEAFGEAYEGWARFCYTSVPPSLVAEAARRLSRL